MSRKKFEKVIVTDLGGALKLLAWHSDKVDGILHTDGGGAPFIAERINHERDSGGDYTRTGRLFRVSPQIVAELKKRKMVEPMMLMGPVRNRLEISETGRAWLMRRVK